MVLGGTGAVYRTAVSLIYTKLHDIFVVSVYHKLVEYVSVWQHCNFVHLTLYFLKKKQTNFILNFINRFVKSSYFQGK